MSRSWKFDCKHIDILQTIKYLKKFEKKFDRSKTTFKEFGRSVLGSDIYNLFVQTVGFSDFEKADFVDTLYDYGYDDVISENKNFSILTD